MVQTPIVRTVRLNGRDVDVHACPWALYRKIQKSGEGDGMDIVEEVVQLCAVAHDGEPIDVLGTSSRAQISRLFELSVSDDDGAKADF